MTVGKRRMAMISDEMILNTIIKIKEKLALQHGVLCESCFLAVLRCSGKMKIKNITMVDFSATNTLYVPNKYEHMNSQNDPYGLQLKAMNVA